MFLHAFLERTGVNGALETIVLYFSIQKDLDTVKKRGKTPPKNKRENMVNRQEQLGHKILTI